MLLYSHTMWVLATKVFRKSMEFNNLAMRGITWLALVV